MNSESQAAAMLRAAHAAAQNGGSPLQGGATGGAGAGNSMSSMFQQQQQMHMQQYPQVDSQVGGLNIANEIKRLQQLHQIGGVGNSSNALLMNPGSGQHDHSTAAFLQMLDSQQRGNSNRFENPLVGSSGSMGISGASLAGSMGMSGAPLSSSICMPESNGGSNNAASCGMSNNVVSMNQMQLPNNFFADARLLMAQNHLQQQATASMNFPGLQPQQLVQGSGVPEMPLPSPHSLFHRDGTRRMRGGVIEPFPVSYRDCLNVVALDCLLLNFGLTLFSLL